ncbi:MAG: S8 family peptidase [Rhizobacter sp.]
MKALAVLLAALLPASVPFPSVAGATAGGPLAAAAVDPNEAVDRFIIRLRDGAADPQPALAGIAGTFGERLDHVRAMSGGTHVVRLGRTVARQEAQEIARLLRADPRIASIEPDLRLHAMAVPNDTMYGQQWHYFEAAGGINLPAAWNVTTGSAGLTVAVVDSGIVPHADLSGRLVPGFDFVSDPTASNDGDGRDADARDPGDYGCNGSTSSWHGTHVAGTIGAASNNGAGVAGINWSSRLLPVRVLGRCGGYTSDIVDGMRWASGMAVPGAPANANPARVINLSLGGDGACSSAFQSAINDVVARGTVVVAAAGNGNTDVSQSQPANCSGVIAVAATNRSGGRASYSNYGSKVTIAAPGGDGYDGILSTLNTGTTTPGADSYAWYQGTSMATPHVSGVVSLMLSIAPSLTPAQVMQRLQQAARPFPAGSSCATWTCGAGIVDAGASVAGLVATPPPAPPPSGGNWTWIAGEHQAFSVSGTQTVRYGAGSSWITRSVSGSGVCSNEFFGSDPAFGLGKECDVSSTAAAPPPSAGTWTWIAGEHQSFSVSGTQTVRYGTGSSWLTRSVTGNGLCSNEFFGSDPAFGLGKECDVSSASTAPPPSGSTWAWIASENQSFTVNGTQTVRYGDGSRWVTRSVMNSGVCGNTFFGSDPAYGIGKHCEVATP